jgi:hypothetical protein
MVRPRRSSAASDESGGAARDQVCFSLDGGDRRWLIWSQELGSMYDYLAKIILLGPSGSGKYAACFIPSILKHAT